MPNSSQLAVKTQWTLTLFNNLIKDLLRPLAVAGAAKTLASDTITVAPSAGEGYYTVDTEGSAAVDTLSTINGGADGDIIYLIAANAARLVQLSSAGNIVLPATWAGGLTFSATIPVGFRYNGSAWVPLSVFDPYAELWYNNSGGSVATGDLVHFDKSGVTRFTTSVIQGNKGIIGVVIDASIANGAWGWIATKGRRRVNLNAAVTVGQALIQSTTVKLAIPNGGAKQDGYLGYVVDATNSPTYCLAEINPSTDRTGGQATLANTQTYTGNYVYNTDTVVVTGMPCTGNNKLLVVVIEYAPGSGSFTNVSYGGTPMTIAAQYTANGYGNQIIIAYCIPTVSANITVRTGTGSGSGTVYAYLFNDVNQSTPVRAGSNQAYATGTAISVTQASATPGDYVLGAFAATSNYSVSARGAGQVNLNDNGTGNHLCVDKVDPCAAAGQTVSWTYSGSSVWSAAVIAIIPV